MLTHHVFIQLLVYPKLSPLHIHTISLSLPLSFFLSFFLSLFLSLSLLTFLTNIQNFLFLSKPRTHQTENSHSQTKTFLSLYLFNTHTHLLSVSLYLNYKQTISLSFFVYFGLQLKNWGLKIFHFWSWFWQINQKLFSLFSSKIVSK